MKRHLLKILMLCLLPAAGLHAQELNCTVKVMRDKILNVDKQVFVTMERSIADFLNTRKWGKDEVAQNERIDCNILISLNSRSEDDIYTATISVQATRPVYNSSYTTPLINYIDRDVLFKYTQFNPLQFDDNRVGGADPLSANLPAILAFYSYMILGLDGDSFAPNGGTAWYKRAQNVVLNAPEDGNKIPGWKAFEDKRNRYWIIDQMLNPRFQSLRDFWYTMHREAMDIMSSRPDEGRTRILSGISTLNTLQQENPGASLIQFFFNAKSDEMLRIVSQGSKAERAPYISILSRIDVPNAGKYNALR